ncbi:MAG: glycoside hydrolase family 68 protein [Sphingopyxis sp.]|nr:glycoside hydrolase family 68 protein [Sphingopyxis sp.]
MDAAHTIPPIPFDLPRPLIDGLDLWDMWPLQRPDGHVADIDGYSVWMVLSAPQLPDPDQRHGIARIRLLTERDGQWRDCGFALPDDLNPGSREWAGSALFDSHTGRVTLYFTAAGERGDARDTFAQRLFEADGALVIEDGVARIIDWTVAKESLVADDHHYIRVDATVGRPGFIKGFRDPAFFRDPADGRDYLLFTASLKQGKSPWNGAIGIARAAPLGRGPWHILPPLLAMDGVNNEPERPHIVYHQGRYILFWSTQRKMFSPDVVAGPNGLYAMVADDVLGPYRPLNGSGLVAANPDDAPFQAYSWWVTADLVVHGFADMLGPDSAQPVDDAAWRRAHFGGVPAPRITLAIDGDVCTIKA